MFQRGDTVTLTIAAATPLDVRIADETRRLAGGGVLEVDLDRARAPAS